LPIAINLLITYSGKRRRFPRPTQRKDDETQKDVSGSSAARFASGIL
jgi:hypothetical protein